MSSYIGMTIGPIIDTLSEASSPVSLWFASSIFSDITRRLCTEISNSQVFGGVQFFSPYFSKDITDSDGVGKFHDRLIFSVENDSVEELTRIIEKVKEETILSFPENNQTPEAKKFLEQYLQLKYVVLNEEQLQDTNVIMRLSPYLDALELMKTFPDDNEANPFRALFLGTEQSGNAAIIRSALFQKIDRAENHFLSNRGGIRAIDDIAAVHGRESDLYPKTQNYFAVVRADGDGMSEFLTAIGSENDKVTEFSKVCLDYDSEAAGLIHDFGGMTIYAGGDDLLFLAPVKNKLGKTIFDLCESINKLFEAKVREREALSAVQQHVPTVSFGIAVQNAKYPLNEALENGYRLLKEAKSGEKNRIVIELRVSKSRNIHLQIANSCIQDMNEILNSKMENVQEYLTYLENTLKNFRRLIEIMDRESRAGRMSAAAYRTAWMNLFDSEEQKRSQTYISNLEDLYYRLFVAKRIPVVGFRAGKELDTLDTFLELLYLRMFFKIR